MINKKEKSAKEAATSKGKKEKKCLSVSKLEEILLFLHLYKLFNTEQDT